MSNNNRDNNWHSVLEDAIRIRDPVEFGAKPYVCLCGRSYKHKFHLQQHKKYECNKPPAFCCQFCPYKAHRRSSLTAHFNILLSYTIVYNSFDQLSVICNNRLSINLLQRYFSYSTILFVGNRPYVCHCGRRYKHKNNLIEHQKYDCGKDPQFQCPHCHYRAKLKSNLKKHIACKHSQLEIHNMSNHCYELVPLTFEQTNILPCLQGFKFLVSTDGEKPFSCDCGRRYVHKCHLRFHQKYECNKAPQFSCRFCPYKAKQKGNLKTHLALKHSEIWGEAFFLLLRQEIRAQTSSSISPKVRMQQSTSVQLQILSL
ncbi:gastrula zinc finger protein XlCGF57.1-like [Macrosteles quadrilineatus]|uniref:gastrula zinc finger protein XlCGF57.1-like n=1 Tax=Macrosteles quadrilineatus TaxID=74068 RepID=UPI0023E15BCA|nr:gastrula zinc finger protein XlCGF57.1-like [Macrosteles quadrilineatus]